jgi:folate-binding protein YgfZ
LRDFPARLAAAVRADGGALIAEDAFEALRIEAGVLRQVPDLQQVLPLEAGLAPEAVSLAKGCYPGQEVLMRQHSQGRPRWRLCGLLLDGDVVPTPGASLEQAGKAVGWISSPAWSPTLGRVIALAYLRPELADPGRTLELAAEGQPRRCGVSPLPFIERDPAQMLGQPGSLS